MTLEAADLMDQIRRTSDQRQKEKHEIKVFCGFGRDDGSLRPDDGSVQSAG